MHKEKSVLVLSGYNIRAVIAFCRWASEKEVTFHVVAKDKNDPIFKTAYKDKVVFTRQSKDLTTVEVNKWIDLVKSRFNVEKILLLPITEYYNRFLLVNRYEIEKNDVIIPLSKSSIYNDISNKYSFSRICKEHGLLIPEEYDFIPESYPFVAKPISYNSQNKNQLKPYLVFNEKDKNDFLNKEDIQYFFYQKFISGESHYLLAYIGEKENIVTFSQENLIQQSNGGSVILARCSNFYKTTVAKKYIEMLQKVGFSGLIMIEVKFDHETGMYYMIEANPRPWGPMQFSIDNKIDLFGAFLNGFGFNIDGDNGDARAKYYFWSGGMMESTKPYAWHNYTEKEFALEFSEIRKHDIYARNDSVELIFDEM